MPNKKKVEEDLDALAAFIEDDKQPIKQSKLCSFSKCKLKPSIIAAVPCSECNLKFCGEHRLPEVHSANCTESLSKKLKLKAKSDARMISNLSSSAKPIDGNTLSVNARIEQERKALKAKLREKIKKAR